MSTNITRFADPDGPEWDVFFLVPRGMSPGQCADSVQEAWQSVQHLDDWTWNDIYQKLWRLGIDRINVTTVYGA